LDLKISQPSKVQHYETLSVKSKQHILKSINQQRNSEAKHNVQPLRPPFSLLSHTSHIPLLSLWCCLTMPWWDANWCVDL